MRTLESIFLFITKLSDLRCVNSNAATKMDQI